ncbi:uncharacterized PE-PGRS family protein PE_PGRS46-like [Haemorhous mexicanus]|uniref:uncharacterized PE-PGRS family protein PE_PGRS46-like n=1 Tax=Haemorhous mexicanus TaxID=30427 RepID=UPI0028BE6A93|nr:uncharacterized PE-PGRS family protein PE_PGRS46-like [Haemorhous mexicanus]
MAARCAPGGGFPDRAPGGDVTAGSANGGAARAGISRSGGGAASGGGGGTGTGSSGTTGTRSGTTGTRSGTGTWRCRSEPPCRIPGWRWLTEHRRQMIWVSGTGGIWNLRRLPGIPGSWSRKEESGNSGIREFLGNLEFGGFGNLGFGDSGRGRVPSRGEIGGGSAGIDPKFGIRIPEIPPGFGIWV